MIELEGDQRANRLIADLLSDTQLLKVLHSSFQDIEVLSQVYGVIPQAIFDTQLAAGFCGYDSQIGYANLVKRVFGAELDKSQTRTNWKQRPLSEKQMDYAINDVVYLQDLYKKFSEELQKNGRHEWFDAEIENVVNAAVDSRNPQLSYQRLNGANLSPIQQRLLVFLSELREIHAQKHDIPRTWVMKDAEMYEVVQDAVPNKQALTSNENKSKFIENHIDRIIAFTNSIDENIEPVWQRSQPLSPDQKQTVKNISKEMNLLSEELGIAKSLIANRKDIESFVSGRGAKFEQGWRATVLKGSSLPSLSLLTN